MLGLNEPEIEAGGRVDSLARVEVSGGCTRQGGQRSQCAVTFRKVEGELGRDFSFHKRQREPSIISGKGPIAYPAMVSDVLRVGGPLQVLRCDQSKPTSLPKE